MRYYKVFFFFFAAGLGFFFFAAGVGVGLLRKLLIKCCDFGAI